MTLVITVAAAVGGGTLATALRLPAGALIGAMLAVGILRMTGMPTFDVPGPGKFLAYCVLGWILGQSFGPDTLGALRAAAVPIVVCVLLFVIFGLALAWALWRFADFDVHTAFLSTAPGGIAQVGALSAESQANVPVVLAVHVLRITSVLFLTSLGLRFLEGRT